MQHTRGTVFAFILFSQLEQAIACTHSGCIVNIIHSGCIIRMYTCWRPKASCISAVASVHSTISSYAITKMWAALPACSCKAFCAHVHPHILDITCLQICSTYQQHMHWRAYIKQTTDSCTICCSMWSSKDYFLVAFRTNDGSQAWAQFALHH